MIPDGIDNDTDDTREWSILSVIRNNNKRNIIRLLSDPTDERRGILQKKPLWS